MDIHIYIYILLGIIITIMGFIIWNVLRKIELQVDAVLDLEDDNADLKKAIRTTYNDMKKIDSKNIFESDDEVGQTFQQLVEVLEKLDGRI